MPKRTTKDLERDPTELARQELEQFKEKILHNEDINAHHFLNNSANEDNVNEYDKDESKGETKGKKQRRKKKTDKSRDMIPELTDIETISRFLLNPVDATTMMQEQAIMIAALKQNRDLKSIPKAIDIWYNIRIGIIEKELESKFNRKFSFFYDEPEELTGEERNEFKRLWGKFDEGRAQLFERSNYGKMYRELQAMPSKLTEKIEKLSESDPEAIAGLEHTEHQALAYYFAMHTELDPIAEYSLTQTQHDEIIDLYKRLDAYMARRIRNVHELTSVEKAFFAFINKHDKELRDKQGMPVLNSILPENFVMLNTRMMNQLPAIISQKAEGQEQENGKITLYGDVDLKFKDKAGDPIKTHVIAEIEGVNLPRTFSEYDREVYNAVSSIWEGDPKHIMTPKTIYRVMTHKANGEDVSPSQVDEIKKSVKKWRHLHLTIDATREATEYFKLRKEGTQPVASFDNYALSMTRIKVKAGGETVEAYKLHAEPILLTYSKISKQIITIPARLLDIKETKNGIVAPDAATIPNSENRIVIKGYLLRYIGGLCNPKSKLSRTLTIKTIMEKCNLNEKKRYAHVDYMRQCLDFWKAEGHIKDYSFKKDGRGVKAIIFEL